MRKRFRLLLAFIVAKSWGQLVAFIYGDACEVIGEDRLRTRLPGLYGPKGTEIAIPRDQEIFKRFQSFASWCPNVSLFLSRSFRHEGTLLLDLGAHAGLISLQTLKMSSNTQNPIVCVEPIPRHLDSLRFNMKNVNCQIIPKVLSGDSKEVKLYVDEFNFGNSSMKPSVVGDTNFHELVLPSVTVREIEKISEGRLIVLKSDLQGLDAYCLSLFSDKFWNNIERGVVEVLACIDLDESYVRNTCARIGKFRNISWNPFGSRRIDELELFDFWISRSGQEKDVYFWN